MAARLLVAERAVTKPPRRARGPLMVLAAVFGRLLIEFRESTHGEYPLTDPVRRRITSWFWAALLNAETITGRAQIERVVPEVHAWVKGSRQPPVEINERTETLKQLDLRCKQPREVEYALEALTLQREPRDLLTGEPVLAARLVANVAGEPVDVHHVFPRAWCDDQGIDRTASDCPANKILLGASANRGAVGKRPPGEYLADFREVHRVPRRRLDQLLRSHFIDPPPAWENDFKALVERRQANLTALLATALDVRHSRR